jgi:hemoglobin-like flavoprotein
MTPEQKQLVRATWAQIVPIADAAAEQFYNRLFEIDASTHALFGASDMPAQRKKLVQTLAVAVGNLDTIESLLPAVEDLGRRHAGYGVTDRHYESVGAALLWTLERGLGHAWTPAVSEAWTAVYGLLSAVMRSAASARATRPGNPVAA